VTQEKKNDSVDADESDWTIPAEVAAREGSDWVALADSELPQGCLQEGDSSATQMVSDFQVFNFWLFGPHNQQRDTRLFSQQNSHQLGFVAHHIHLCFQARMSQLAPDPRL